MSGSKQDRSGNTGRNTIVIGQFNLSNYDRFSEYHRDGNLYFFHASTTWFIKDKRIRRCLLRPGDFVEQVVLEEVEENSMVFIRDLENYSKDIAFDGIKIIPLLRFDIIRKHSMLLESYITLSECIKRYKPEMLVIDSSCNRNYRSNIYHDVVECLSKEYNIPISYLASKNIDSEFKRIPYIQNLIKEQVKKTISLIIKFFCRPSGKKKTIIFSGSFNQMAQVMKWFADSKVYNLVYFKQGIPLNKTLFFLKHKIMWKKIPVNMSENKGNKNTLLDSFINSWFKSGDVIDKFFRGEDLLAGLMKQFIKDDIEQNWGIITHLIRISNKVFLRTDVSAVFLDEDQTLHNRIIVDTANYNKNETFVLCHGILNQRTNFIFSAKNIFTYGTKASQQIKNYSNDHQPKIHEIGTPRLDGLKRLKTSESRHKIQRDFSIPADKKIILFLLGDLFFDKIFYTNRLKEDTQMVIYKTAKKLIDMIKKNESLFLIIKLKDDGKEKSFVSDTYNIGESDRIKVTGAYDIDYLVKGCDVIINTVTTVSYHGLVAQKPVIRVKPKIDNSLWEFINTGAEEAVEIDSLAFEEKIMDLLYDERKRNQFIQKANQCLIENYRNEDLRVRERLLKITETAIG